MSTSKYKLLCLGIGLTSVVAFAGCSNYVKKSDFNAELTKLQNTNQSQQQQIDSNTQQLQSLEADMKQHFAKYDAQIAAVKGRISVNNIAHFAFNSATLPDAAKAKLDAFANVMNAHHANAVVTVEGFTDPAGSAAYNQHLGMQRARAVRDYLVKQDGMNAKQVRAVSYGESRARQVVPGATRAKGQSNRRVSVVIDFAGAES